ncbi:hypothetical protein, partial [Halomonas organivorans]
RAKPGRVFFQLQAYDFKLRAKPGRVFFKLPAYARGAGDLPAYSGRSPAYPPATVISSISQLPV